MSDAIGPATDSVLLAVVAIGILVVTAPFLANAAVDVPAASATGPDVDVPASEAENLETEDASHVSADAVDGNTTTSGDVADGDDGAAGEGTDGPTVDIEVDASDTGGHLVPGRDVVVTVTRDGEPAEDARVDVAGSSAGTTDSDGQVSATVPGSEQFGVEAALQGDVSASRRFSVDTDLDVEIVGPVSRTSGAAVHASVHGYDVPGATVSRDGQRVNETDEDGFATFDVPTGADGLDVEVTHGEATGSASVDLDLEVGLDTLVPAAGSSASVSARYDGGTPADVELYVVSGDVGDSPATVVDERDPTLRAAGGAADVSLPASSSVTVIASDGQQTATATIDGLLRNLAIVLVIALSVILGVPITSLRVLRWLDVDAVDPGSGPTIADLIADVGAALVAGVIAIARLPERLPFHRIRIPTPALSMPSVPSIELPSISLPTLRLPRLPTVSLPSLSLPTLRAPKLSLPSLSLSGLSRGGSDDDGTETASTATAPTDPFAADASPEELTMTERELVRAAVRDLGRLSGLRRVETRTPGQIGRTALDRALPREPVENIVGTVRDVEYAGSDPTTEEASRVKRAVRRLRDAVRDRGEDE